MKNVPEEPPSSNWSFIPVAHKANSFDFFIYITILLFILAFFKG